MKRITMIFLLLAFVMSAGGVAAAGKGKANSTGAAPEKGTQSPAVHSNAGSNMYLFLSDRKLHCARDNQANERGLKNCVFNVNLEVDGPVRYEGAAVVACNAKFGLHYLGAYKPVTDSIAGKVSVHVKGGLGRAVMKLPVRRTATLYMTNGFKLLKVDVNKLVCHIQSTL